MAKASSIVESAKPVGLVPIRATRMGRAYMAAMDRLRPGRRVRPRDLRFFWAALDEQGLGGTVERPRRAEVPDLAADVASRVRRLLDEPGR